MHKEPRKKSRDRWKGILSYLSNEEQAIKDEPIEMICEELDSAGIDHHSFIKKFEEQRAGLEQEESLSELQWPQENRFLQWVRGLDVFFRNPVFSVGLIAVMVFAVVKIYRPGEPDVVYRDSENAFVQKIAKMNQQILELNQQKQYPIAITIATEVVDLLSAHAGEFHPDTAKAINNLALLYKKIQRYPKSEELYLRALNIQSKILKEGHEDVIDTLNNLALLYEAKKDFKKAESVYRQIIVLREKTLGVEDPKTDEARQNLLSLYEVIKKGFPR